MDEPFNDRRKDPQRVLARLEQIERSLEIILEKMEEVSRIREAIPEDGDGDRDYEGHRKYHEQLITESLARQDFWRRMKYDLVRWGLIVFLGWAFIALLKAGIGAASKGNGL